MKIIHALSLAVLAAALTVSASAFPYTNPAYSVGPLNSSQVPPSPKGGSIASSESASNSTIAVYTQGRGVAKTTTHKAHVKPAAQH
jgi:hypothetical protein